ncbi:MAG TPA: ThiF family adenylyltransferase [Aldersonia sp.]
MIDILHPTRDRRRIAQVCADGYRCVDAWPDVLVELGAIERPDTDQAERARHIARCWPERAVAAASRYVVYPWRRTMVRLPERDLFHRMRTARNRWLLDEGEQRAWAQARIGIAGLSVGSSVLTVCALTGARRLRVTDPDTLGLTNLNRLAGSVCDLGTAKLDLAMRRVLELDPYASVEGFANGYTPSEADRFLDGLTVLVEEMDDLAMKLHIRIRAKAARIPVVMVTDNGDDVILDVERFDLDPDYPVLHGRVGADDLSGVDLGDLSDPACRVRLAGDRRRGVAADAPFAR